MNITHVSNVEKAIQLATKFKNENTYDWFRGQVSFKKPTSSFHRKITNIKAQNEYEERIQLLLRWLEKMPQLSYLLKDEYIDELFAILQHYGFPTNYIDFTTEPSVAGFFASHSKSPVFDELSVIYCLKANDLKLFYEDLHDAQKMLNHKVEFIKLDVSNLWRLQAQHGHFLYTNHDWTQLYEMDCILFPHTGLPSYPPTSQIYPEHKSSLEQLLDQYFFSEKSYLGMKKIRELKNDKGEKIHIHLFRNEGLIEGYDVEHFSNPLIKLASWSQNFIANWNIQPVESFHQVIGKSKKIKLRNGENVPTISEQILVGVQSALGLDKTLRGYAVDWYFDGLPEALVPNYYIDLVRQAWNGMRNLPYSDEDIAYTFSELLKICAVPEIMSFESNLISKAFNKCIPDSFEIEIANFNESSSRAYCSEDALLKIIDNQWKESLLDQTKSITCTKVLQITNNPSLIFDFDKLVKLFSREIIPSQLARRRELVLYNPAHLTVFGLS